MQYYGPELEQRLRQHLKPTNKSWRVDEIYVRVEGRWCYLYRAIDSKGATIDFLLSALRDADAAKRLFRKALGDRSHPQPRVINTDLAPIYGSAIPDSKREGTLRKRCRHRPVQYLNNILEQDHRAIKRRVNAKQVSDKARILPTFIAAFGSFRIGLGLGPRRSRIKVRVDFRQRRSDA